VGKIQNKNNKKNKI